jgi:T5orf172 domain
MATDGEEIAGELPAPCHACGAGLGLRDSRGLVCSTCGWRVGDVPDSDLPPVRVDVVYYLRFRDRIKIGTSGNPRSRLSQLRYDELLAFERGDRAVEQRRHAEFSSQRFPGSEWFHAHEALTAHIQRLRADVDDPWNLYQRWMSEQLSLRVG